MCQFDHNDSPYKCAHCGTGLATPKARGRRSTACAKRRQAAGLPLNSGAFYEIDCCSGVQHAERSRFVPNLWNYRPGGDSPQTFFAQSQSQGSLNHEECTDSASPEIQASSLA